MKRAINCDCNCACFVFALSLMAELEWVEVAENTFEDGGRAWLACIVCVSMNVIWCKLIATCLIATCLIATACKQS